MQYEAVDNAAVGATGGAGIQSARLISEKGTEAVVTGNFGPNATSALQAAGVRMFIGAQGRTVEEAVRDFGNGAFQEVNSPSVESHFGMAQPAGGGRGQGMGRGMGQGQGRGVGQGMAGTSGAAAPGAMAQQARSTANESVDVDQLKGRAREIQEELQNLQNKIDDLESKGPSSQHLVVDKELCIGCGRCEDACPQNAITVNEIAEVDASLCTLCGKCVSECPVDALRME